MNKRPLIVSILLLTIQTTASAEIYRCELADGRVIYGDKPVNLSDECRPVKEDAAKEYFSVQQPAPRRPTSGQSVAADLEAERDAASGEPPDSWVERATTLVNDYNDARRRRARDSYMVDKRKAMQDMAIINQEKEVMLQELQDSSLDKREREEIRGILAQIPEDAP